MTKIKNVPDTLPLDDECVLSLSIAGAWLHNFPPALREYARLHSPHFYSLIQSKEVPTYGLLSSAYVGVALLPTSYGRFITQAERVNKLEPHPLSGAFRKDPVARENSAAGEFGLSRGELKRLIKAADALAGHFGFDSYDAIFNCKDDILQDPSPFAPTDRKTYAQGPLYLWDFAKAVKEHELVGMSFDTFGGWVLFTHLKDGVVYGHALYPAAHRFGAFYANPLIDLRELQMRGYSLSTIIEVPLEVQGYAKSLAERRFPGHPFEFIEPPMLLAGEVLRSRSTRAVRCPSPTEL